MTVGELLDRASSHEISEWKVFLQIEASEAKQARAGSGQSVSFT